MMEEKFNYYLNELLAEFIPDEMNDLSPIEYLEEEYYQDMVNIIEHNKYEILTYNFSDDNNDFHFIKLYLFVKYLVGFTEDEFNDIEEVLEMFVNNDIIDEIDIEELNAMDGNLKYLLVDRFDNSVFVEMDDDQDDYFKFLDDDSLYF